MTWLTWRLQRTELALLALILLVLAGALLPTKADLIAETRPYLPEDCPVPLSGHDGATELGCSVPVGRLYQVVSQWLQWFDVIPLLAALLLALPVVLELENGTYQLAWTQGVTRGRWMRTKLAVVGLGGVVFAALFALAFHWWSSPMDQLNGKFDKEWYALRGTLPIGYTLFAIGLMLAVGVALRRPVLTIVLASTAYLATSIPTSVWLRSHLFPSLTRPTYGTAEPGMSAEERAEGGAPDGDWHLSQHFEDRAGNTLSNEEGWNLCNETPWQCMEEHGLVHVTTYHPASHYWPLQLVETGLYLAAGAALIGFAAWYVLRRIE